MKRLALRLARGIKDPGRVVRATASAALPWMDRLANARWHDNPLIPEPLAGRDHYEKAAVENAAVAIPGADEYIREIGFDMDGEWLDQLARHTKVFARCLNNPAGYHNGRILYATVRGYIERQRPAHVTIVETGTARGFTALCMAKALDDAGVPGTIITFDVLPHETAMYWDVIDDNDGRKTRAELLAPFAGLAERRLVFVQGDTRVTLPRVRTGRVNVAFFDGVHKEDYVTFEFQEVSGRQLAGDIAYFHDYTPGKFPGVCRAVDKLCRDYGYEKLLVPDGPGDQQVAICTKKANP